MNASYVGLAARVAAILLGVVMLMVADYGKFTVAHEFNPKLTYHLNAGPILRPALLLLLIAALASLPMPSPVPRAMQPVAEALGAAIVIATLSSTTFLPYLLAPVVTAGLAVGAAAASACVGVAWLVILGSAGANGSKQLIAELGTGAL